MVLMYSLKGEKQKQLAAEVGKALGKPVKYLGTPIFAFQAGKYSIDQNGNLVGPDNLDLEDALHRAGFDAIERAYDEPDGYEYGVNRRILHKNLIRNTNKEIHTGGGEDDD